MSDYTPPRPTTERARILAILDCIRANLGKPEPDYLRALAETYLANGNPCKALICAVRALESDFAREENASSE